MNLVRKALSALGGIFLAALLIAALAPKAAHGLVATLVQIVNTAADPVPNKDVDVPARHAWTASCSFSTNFLGSNCVVTSPANAEVVVQAESYSFTADPTNKTFLVVHRVTTGTQLATFYNAYYDNGFYSDRSFFAATSSTTIYLDPSTSLNCSIETNKENPTYGLGGFCTFSGYYVTIP